jgi:hypothetical protein
MVLISNRVVEHFVLDINALPIVQDNDIPDNLIDPLPLVFLLDQSPAPSLKIC